MKNTADRLIGDIRACRLCEDDMEREPNPILQLSTGARVLIAGQAPGNKADVSGIPFDDPSGDRLRDWMRIDRDTFYDAQSVAIIPMGFCFPGYDKKGGDLPPLSRCAGQWRAKALAEVTDVRVTLLVGRYAQLWHLGSRCPPTLTETVRGWKNYARANIFPVPHPSWRNTGWLKRNPWFETDVLPEMRMCIQDALG